MTSIGKVSLLGLYLLCGDVSLEDLNTCCKDLLTLCPLAYVHLLTVTQDHLALNPSIFFLSTAHEPICILASGHLFFHTNLGG